MDRTLSDDDFGQLVVLLAPTTHVPPERLARLVGAWLDADGPVAQAAARHELSDALGYQGGRGDPSKAFGHGPKSGGAEQHDSAGLSDDTKAALERLRHISAGNGSDSGTSPPQGTDSPTAR